MQAEKNSKSIQYSIIAVSVTHCRLHKYASSPNTTILLRRGFVVHHASMCDPIWQVTLRDSETNLPS